MPASCRHKGYFTFSFSLSFSNKYSDSGISISTFFLKSGMDLKRIRRLKVHHSSFVCRLKHLRLIGLVKKEKYPSNITRYPSRRRTISSSNANTRILVSDSWDNNLPSSGSSLSSRSFSRLENQFAGFVYSLYSKDFTSAG